MPGEPPKLRLHVPEPTGRPGQATDFSYLRVSAPGEVPRPAVDIVASHTGTMAWKLVRVLDDAGRALGPWAPQVEVEVLRRGLRAMLRPRAFDARMLIAQRQRKISFYFQSLGEEAIAVAHALALQPDHRLHRLRRTDRRRDPPGTRRRSDSQARAARRGHSERHAPCMAQQERQAPATMLFALVGASRK